MYQIKGNLWRQLLNDTSGNLDQNWMSTDRWACVTGNAQIAFFLRKMSNLFNDNYMNTAADYLINDLKKIHFMGGIEDPNIYGGLPGSYPIGGSYCSYAIPNWGVKFFADALLQRVVPISGQKLIG